MKTAQVVTEIKVMGATVWRLSFEKAPKPRPVQSETKAVKIKRR